MVFLWAFRLKELKINDRLKNRTEKQGEREKGRQRNVGHSEYICEYKQVFGTLEFPIQNFN